MTTRLCSGCRSSFGTPTSSGHRTSSTRSRGTPTGTRRGCCSTGRSGTTTPGPWACGAPSSRPSVATTATCSSRTSSWSGRCSRREEGSSTRPRCTCADCRPPPLDSWNSAFAKRTTTWRNPPGWRSSWCSGRRLDVARRRPGGLLAAAVASVLVAQVGRLRHGGNRVFDRVSPVLRPLLDGGARLPGLAGGLPEGFSRGGCTYAGGVIRRAATPRVLRRRLRGRLAG